jgi:hypothetical protein
MSAVNVTCASWTGVPEGLFRAVHQYWEREIFRGIPLGKRDATGRELSEEEAIMSNEIREFVWESYESQGGGSFAAVFCVEHSHDPEVSREQNRYGAQVKMAPGGEYAVESTRVLR